MRIETITRELYQFDELTDSAKEKAREWFASLLEPFDYDYVIEDAKIIAALMGIDIKEIYWSGFYSQGDGACFTGSYSYKKGSVKAVKEYAPQDKALHRIVESLANLQRENGENLEAEIEHRGPYTNSSYTDINIFYSTDTNREVADETEKALKEELRNFMNWIYKQLEQQNEYLNSNESIDENIRANEYEFLANGKRA
jgi:hypothetical protein